MENIYRFREAEKIISPSLIYYRDIIRSNIRKAVSMAGGADRLWPHVKTHKMAQMVRLQMEEGISRFKCATIAEAEMAAGCGASDVLLAYPLAGPNIDRFIRLIEAFPSVHFWAIGDDEGLLRLLGSAAESAGLTVRTLADVNMGMDRTGVSLDALEEFYVRCCQIGGLSLQGLHCYDGHRSEHDFSERMKACQTSADSIRSIRSALSQRECDCSTVVLGGTPSFPCYRTVGDVFFSPGTLFVNDYGYTEKFPDLSFTPGAAILTRAISRPAEGRFTLDLGYKGIAADPAGARGIIAGMEHVKELFQSEEHWAFCMEPGYEDQCPQIGEELYVIPTHICPTSALYPEAVVVDNGKAAAVWQVTARNRRITY